jgi:hypothetical protein
MKDKKKDKNKMNDYQSGKPSGTPGAPVKGLLTVSTWAGRAPGKTFVTIV